MRKMDRAYIKQHLPFFLILFGTILFWLSIRFNKTSKATIEVPINYKVPQGLVLSQDTPREISAVVEGRIYNLLDADQAEPIHIGLKNQPYQEVSSVELGRKIQDVLGRKVTLESLPVSYLQVRLDSAISKRIPISTLDIEVKPALYSNLISDVILKPDSVTISGPESKIKNIDYISAMPFKGTDLNKDLVNYAVPLDTHIIGYNMSIDTAYTYISVLVDRLIEKDVVCSIPNEDYSDIIPSSITIHGSYAARIKDIDCEDYVMILSDIPQNSNKKLLKVKSQNDFMDVLSTSVDTVLIVKK